MRRKPLKGGVQEIDMERLKIDFPLYAKTCLKIQVKKGGELVPFELNAAQREVQKAIDAAVSRGVPPRIIELKARQVGMSTDAEGRLFHGCHLHENRTALIVAHKLQSAQAIFEMSRRFYDNLPPSLRPFKKYFSKGQIQFEHNGSRLQVEVAGSGTGRGFTAQYIHLSELAFYQEPEEVLEAVLQTTPDTTDSLVIVESTAKGLNYFYEMWNKAKAGESDFVPIFIPWFQDPGYVMPTAVERSDLSADEQDIKDRYDLTMPQMAWRRWAIRNKCDGSVERFRQEYPCSDEEAFVYSGRAVFDRDAIKYYNTFVPPKVPVESLPDRCDVEWDADKEVAVFVKHDYGPARLYTPPVPKHKYIVSIDPSEGYGPLHVSSYLEGSKPSPIVVLDQMNLEVPFVWHGRRRPDRLAHTAAAVARYFNDGLIVWDASPHGLTFQVELEKIYWNYYVREAPPDSLTKHAAAKAGYGTNVRTRIFLVNTVRRFIDDKLGVIRSPELVSELGTFYYNDTTGRPEALSGHFDDLIFALAMAVEVHRGSPDNDIVPLDPQDVETVQSFLHERRIAASMGAPPPVLTDRINITAAQLEKLDERDGLLARKRRGLHHQV